MTRSTRATRKPRRRVAQQTSPPGNRAGCQQRLTRQTKLQFTAAWYRGWDQANVAKPVAAAADETAPDPTPAQAEAENYKTGKADWRGLKLSVENKKGSVRSKVGPDGKTAWSVTMPAHYGRILGTKGADGDHVDFYMGDMENSDFVLIVNQVDAETGAWDEHKVILGTGSEAQARRIYEQGFSDGKGKDRIGSATATSFDGFKAWLDGADLTKPTEPVKARAKAEPAKTPEKPAINDAQKVQKGEKGFSPLSSAADRPMPDLTKIDYETFDDKTREDGQMSPGKREARSETGRWARAVVKALKDAGFTPTLNRNGKPMKAVDFGYAMYGEPDETNIHLTAPNRVQFYAKIHKSSMSRDKMSILVQFTGEPPKPNYSRPFLGGNRWMDADLRPSEAAEKIIQWAEQSKPKEAKKPAPAATGLLSGLSAEKQARAAELKAKLAAKARNQTSSGIDPDYIILGGELVGLYIEGGVKKFGQMLRDFAETTGLSIKEAQAPMRAAYNHVRDDMDLDGQDVSDMDDGAAVMAEVRAAIAEEQNLSQNEATPPILEEEPANEATDERDTQQQDTRDDPPSVEGSEPDGDTDTGGRERGDERGDGGSSARDGEPSVYRPDMAGSVERDGPAGSGDETAERQGVSPGNFVIPADFNLGAGTPGQKIDANIAAIRLVKALQSENRHPTKAEQTTLARYVGWGGLKRVFDPKETGNTSQWGRAQADLRELLTKDQYRAAAYSTAHAHYTSPDVVSAMWGAMQGFGFEGGRALEPTVGTGNFLGLQPADLAAKTEWYAAELDDITGAIAEYLYPDARVFAGKGFEDAPFRPNTIDVAIGNPPFGSETLKSDLHPEIPPLSVHNYIIAKTGILLRPGGIMGMVVTSRFLDTPNPQARSYLNEHFNFMGAVRLPNTAFKANAGTEVTTDIVWFQKRRDGEAKGDQSWLETGVKRDDVPMNGYFAANPDMMLGTPSMEGTMYGADPEFTLKDDGRDLPKAMREAMGRIKGSLSEREQQLEDAVVAEKLTSDLAIGESLLTEDGKVMMRLDDDANGNAVVDEITAKSPWGPITRELMEAADAIGSAAQAIQQESVEDAKAAVDAALLSIARTGSLKEDGEFKKNAPTGVGKEVYEALQAIHEGLSDGQPYFGPAQKKAMKALKSAVDKKTIGPKKFAALKGMLSLRRDTIDLLAAEMHDDPKMDVKRRNLRRQYRAFVKKHGFVNDPANDGLVGGLPRGRGRT